MNTFRTAASKLARNFAYYSGLSQLLARLENQPRILMLHGVGTPESPPEMFRAQLSFLARLFRIVPLEQTWESGNLDGDARPKLALTFDDGLRNNFTVAYPILKEFKATATFFVCPGLIDSGKWLWNHECRARLAFLSSQQRQHFAESLGLTSDAIEPIIQKLKDMPHNNRVQLETQLRKETSDFVPTDLDHKRFDIMNWQELKTMDQDLITIGGHSTNHEILPRLDAEHLEREVADCRFWLERELGRPVLHFCYPNGAYDAQVLSCVGRHFKSAVTTKAGLVSPRPSLLELPRIATPLSLPDLAWEMQRPSN